MKYQNLYVYGILLRNMEKDREFGMKNFSDPALTSRIRNTARNDLLRNLKGTMFSRGNRVFDAAAEVGPAIC
jgi:hypothetical protein